MSEPRSPSDRKPSLILPVAGLGVGLIVGYLLAALGSGQVFSRIVGAGALLGSAVGIVIGWLISISTKEPDCPSCGQRLRKVTWIRATVVVDGQRAPASWSFLLCESCGARYKQPVGQELEPASEEDWSLWSLYCREPPTD